MSDSDAVSSFERTVDRADQWLAANAKLVSVVSGGWMFLTCAIHARYIVLPKIPFLTDQAAMWLSIGVTVLWWGVLLPRIEKRRQEREE
ncbi:MAG: hypothetical protein AAFU77_00705 [Myxococcota bacterium]